MIESEDSEAPPPEFDLHQMYGWYCEAMEDARSDVTPILKPHPDLANFFQKIHQPLSFETFCSDVLQMEPSDREAFRNRLKGGHLAAIQGWAKQRARKWGEQAMHKWN